MRKIYLEHAFSMNVKRPFGLKDLEQSSEKPTSTENTACSRNTDKKIQFNSNS